MIRLRIVKRRPLPGWARIVIPIAAILVTLISAAALFRLLIGRRSIWALGVPVAMIFVFWLWRESAGLVVQMGMLDVGLIVSLFVGPLLVARRERPAGGRIAIPGRRTTAALLLRLLGDFETVEMR